MEPRDADVLVHRDTGAEQIRADPRLVHHGAVRRAGGHDQHVAALVDRLAFGPDRAGAFVLEGLGEHLPHGRAHRPVGARHEHARRAGLRERKRDPCSLLRCLARPEDHLGRALPELAMGVDAREPEIAVGQLNQPVGRVLRVDAVICDGREQLFQLAPRGHVAESTRRPHRPAPTADRRWRGLAPGRRASPAPATSR